MPIDYPSSPTVNQIYTYNGKAWVFNGTAWLGAGFVGVNASSANTASYVVQRDASGNFSAGTITATLTGNATNVSGIVPIANGGTGLTTLTANNVILGNGTSTPAFVAPSTNGNLLTSNGTTWASTPPAAVSGVLTGTITAYGGATAPAGYLLCDGSSVSSSTYLALHAVISNTYGGSAYTGAAGLSFNLPDYRGRTLVGVGTGSGLTARTLGGTVGTESHTVGSSNITQFSTGNMSNNSTHNHQIGTNIFLRYTGTGGNRGDYQVSPNSWTGTANNDGVTTASTSVEHSHTVGSASPTAISNMQPSIGVNFIIKT